MTRQITHDIMSYMVSFVDRIDTKLNKSLNVDMPESKYNREIYFENLLHNFCQVGLSKNWNARSGIYDGICMIIQSMGATWSRQFEVELMHLAIFCLKDSPNEVFRAEEEAMKFYLQMLSLLYGQSSEGKGSNSLVRDVLSLPDDELKEEVEAGKSNENEEHDGMVRGPSSEAILPMLVSELGSPKQIVR